MGTLEFENTLNFDGTYIEDLTHPVLIRRTL